MVREVLWEVYMEDYMVRSVLKMELYRVRWRLILIFLMDMFSLMAGQVLLASMIFEDRVKGKLRPGLPYTDRKSVV